MTPERASLIDALASRIDGLVLPHPARVAIDGPDAAGKTTLADHLAGVLRARGRTVIRASGDDFAQPAAIRYRRGRDSAEGCYEDTLDRVALRRLLLDPLGPGGDRRHVVRHRDLRTDRLIDPRTAIAPRDAVLLVDGVFLAHPALAGAWDLRLFLLVPAEESVRRALARDVPGLGNPAEVAARYRARYLPAQALYATRDRPGDTADLVIDMTDPDRPRPATGR